MRGTPPDASYSFRHALVRDAAYASLLNSERRLLHRRVAGVLAGAPDARAETLARHHEGGEEFDAAAAAWRRAADEALARSASAEAARHLESAIGALARLPESRERLERELPLQITLAQALWTSVGYGDPGAERAIESARALASRLQSPEGALAVVLGAWVTAIARCEMDSASGFAKELFRLAEQGESRRWRVWALTAVGGTDLARGRFAPALERFREAIALYPEAESAREVLDPGVMAYFYGARAAWACGRLDESRERLVEGLALAERVATAHTVAAAYTWGAVDATLRREPQEALELSERVVRFSREHALRLRAGEGLFMRGWSRAWLGEFEASGADLRQALEDFSSANTSLGLGIYLGWRAEALALAGDLSGALAGVEDALRAPDELARSDALRIRGDILVRRAAREAESSEQSGVGPPAEGTAAAESSYREAISVAQAQASPSFELRAAIGLARLLREQGRLAEAREALAPACNRFADALTSADLKTARTLLAELAAVQA